MIYVIFQSFLFRFVTFQVSTSPSFESLEVSAKISGDTRRSLRWRVIGGSHSWSSWSFFSSFGGGAGEIKVDETDDVEEFGCIFHIMKFRFCFLGRFVD